MPYDGDATSFEVKALPDPKTLTTPRERLEYMEGFLRGLDGSRFRVANWFSRNGTGCVFVGRAPGPLLEECGTAACIAGWTLALFAPGDEPSFNPATPARKLLGLDGSRLFYPPDHKARDYTPTQAADVIAHLLKTGEVDWSVAGASS